MEQGGGLVAKIGKLDPRSAADQLRDKDDAAIAGLLATLHIGHAVEILEEFPPERRQRIAARRTLMVPIIKGAIRPTISSHSLFSNGRPGVSSRVRRI